MKTLKVKLLKELPGLPVGTIGGTLVPNADLFGYSEDVIRQYPDFFQIIPCESLEEKLIEFLCGMPIITPGEHRKCADGIIEKFIKPAFREGWMAHNDCKNYSTALDKFLKEGITE